MLQVLFEMIKIVIKDTIKKVIKNIHHIICAIFCLGPSIFVLLNFNYLRELLVENKYHDNIHGAVAALILFMIATPLINLIIFIIFYSILELLIIYTKETYEKAKKSVNIRYAQKAQAGDISLAKTTGHGGLSMTDEK